MYSVQYRMSHDWPWFPYTLLHPICPPLGHGCPQKLKVNEFPCMMAMVLIDIDNEGLLPAVKET